MDPTARFAELVDRDARDVPLDQAMLAIAAHANPDLDVAARLAQLDELASRISPVDAAHLATALFVAEGFAGNRLQYGDPRNSYLDEVLDRRLGIPISLCVLMMEVGRRAGIALHGVGMPGHFLVGAGPGEFFDPFHEGARLDARGCAARFAEVNGQGAFRVEYLEPVGAHRILERVLTNLQAAFGAPRPADLAWATRLLLCLPDLPARRRGELAALLGGLGHYDEAASELDAIARGQPDDGGDRVAQAARAFRARTN